MKKKHIKLTNLGKFTILLLIILPIFITILFTKNNIKGLYHLDVNIPNINNKNVNKKINSFVEEKKKELFKSVKKSKKYLKEEKLKYELIINNEIYENDGLKSIHLTSYLFIGGNHYFREDKSFHIDKKSNQEINIISLLKSESNLDTLSKITYNKVKKEIEKLGYPVIEELLINGTKPSVENYNDFYLSKDGLNIIFAPDTVAEESIGEIKILIKFNEIKDILRSIPDFEKEIVDDEKIIQEERNIEQFKDKKIVAFTFDDGPSPHTNYLLDRLKEHNWKVTFFMLGSRVNSYSDTVKRVYEEGHIIGNHTYSHLNLKKLNDNDAINEVVKTNNLIKDITGYTPIYVRPPYGNINNVVKTIPNTKIVLWNVDTEDWKVKDAEKVKSNILRDVKDKSVVLLHDLYKTSIDGVIEAMIELEKEGYSFVTIEEYYKIINGI